MKLKHGNVFTVRQPLEIMNLYQISVTFTDLKVKYCILKVQC